MNFRESGFAGETDHAFRNQPEPSAALKAAFSINPSNFYTKQASQRTAAGVMHVLVEQKRQED